jgi:hypothetical protein
MLRTLYM